MANRSDITPELCRQLLRYEPETGKLFWLPRPASMFRDTPCNGGLRFARWACDKWNTRYAGSEAFITPHSAGYLEGQILKIKFLAHRVSWAIHDLKWPNVIDHINGDRTDNRIINLRNVDTVENHRNMGLRQSSQSGVNGVTQDKGSGKWIAQITVRYKIIRLGKFETMDQAIAVRREAEIKYGFAEGHGERPSYRESERD